MNKRKPDPVVAVAPGGDVRLMMALTLVEKNAMLRSVRPGFALESAARVLEVDCLALAIVWIEKLVGAQRARAALAALQEGDRATRVRAANDDTAGA